MMGLCHHTMEIKAAITSMREAVVTINLGVLIQDSLFNNHLRFAISYSQQLLLLYIFCPFSVNFCPIDKEFEQGSSSSKNKENSSSDDSEGSIKHGRASGHNILPPSKVCSLLSLYLMSLYCISLVILCRKLPL